jgi:CheY-like chemotaxis protein
MGGDITVKSTPGKGSVFTVRLPAEVVPAADDVREARAAVPRRAQRILVIDDDPTARDLLRRALDREGFDVVCAGSGEEGLRVAREVRPSAITLDVMMPQMDGWAVLAALKGDSDLREIPVIILSIVDNRSLGFALGASDYLTKPVDRERLMAALQKHHRPGSPCPVLVVEDDPDQRNLLRGILEREGWSVSEAENGQIALNLMASSPPELILLDLMMPEMDGFRFVTSLKAREEWRRIPIIVITARDLTEEERATLLGQVDRIITKGGVGKERLLAEARELVVARLGEGE